MGSTEPGEPEVEELSEEETEGATKEPKEGEPEPEEGEEPDEEDEDTEPELIDVEIGGKTYKVHPELRDGIMLKADYTRKTQEVAEQRKALEARITEAAQVSDAERNAHAHMIAIDAALEQYQTVDWDALERQNPTEAHRHFRNFTLLQQQRGTAETQLKGATEKREAETQRLDAERFAQSMTELKAAIPDWSEAKAVELRNFAVEHFGFTEEDYRGGLLDPRAIRLLNTAFAAVKSAQPKPKPAAQVAKPAAKVRGGSAPKAGLDDRLSADEWVRRRNEQVAKR